MQGVMHNRSLHDSVHDFMHRHAVHDMMHDLHHSCNGHFHDVPQELRVKQ